MRRHVRTCAATRALNDPAVTAGETEREPSTVRPLAGTLGYVLGSWLTGHCPWVLVWTGACYWYGVGGFVFNSSSSGETKRPPQSSLEQFKQGAQCKMAPHPKPRSLVPARTVP